MPGERRIRFDLDNMSPVFRALHTLFSYAVRTKPCLLCSAKEIASCGTFIAGPGYAQRLESPPEPGYQRVFGYGLCRNCTNLKQQIQLRRVEIRILMLDMDPSNETDNKLYMQEDLSDEHFEQY